MPRFNELGSRSYRLDLTHGLAVALSLFLITISLGGLLTNREAEPTVASADRENVCVADLVSAAQQRKRLQLRWRREYAAHYARSERARAEQLPPETSEPDDAAMSDVVPASHETIVSEDATRRPAAERSAAYWEGVADAAAKKLDDFDRRVTARSGRAPMPVAEALERRPVPNWLFWLATGISIPIGTLAAAKRDARPAVAANANMNDNETPPDLLVRLPASFFAEGNKKVAEPDARWTRVIFAFALLITATLMLKCYHDPALFQQLAADPLREIAAVWEF